MNRRMFVQALALPCFTAPAADARHQPGTNDPRPVELVEV
jgi:hypothetical protein